MLGRIVNACRQVYRWRQFRVGTTVSRFIATDIRRDVKVVDASEVEQGYITASVRTWNVLYTRKGIVPMPRFGEPQRRNIESLWDWEESH